MSLGYHEEIGMLIMEQVEDKVHTSMCTTGAMIIEN